MKTRAAPFGAVLGLALVGAGTCHALSLRGSAAELSLGDHLPGTTAIASKASSRVRLENVGAEPARMELAVVRPPPEGLKDGYEPWPYLEGVRLPSSAPELQPGEAAELELAVTVPNEPGLRGGQYQFDVLETGRAPAGSSLTLKTRVLLSVGAPLAADGDRPSGGWEDLPGFALAPPSAELEKVPWEGIQSWTTVKIVNAGTEDLTVSLTPARDWDETARARRGYEPAPNPRWLLLDPGVVKVRAGAIGSVRIGVSLPRQARYAGRRWAFVAAVDAVSGVRRSRRYFALNVRTPDWEEDMRAR